MTSTASGREGTGGTGPDGPAVDGVLFDVDDTLVDSTGAFRAALADVAREYLPALPADRHDEVLALWRADPNGHYRRYTRGELDYRAQRRARANEIQAAFGGAQLDDAAFAAWDEVFEEGFVRAWAPHTDADDVVRRLLDAGVAVAALTNAAVGYQTAKLERVGLADRVRVVVGVDTLGVGKPDPRVFAEACRRLGTAPERTAYVGDELDVDALGAVAAGLVGVWVDRPGPRRVDVPPEHVTAAREAGVRIIRSLTELPEALGLA